jgi:hypothetical protein
MSGPIEEAAKRWLADPTYQKVTAGRSHLSEGNSWEIPLIRR